MAKARIDFHQRSKPTEQPIAANSERLYNKPALTKDIATDSQHLCSNEMSTKPCEIIHQHIPLYKRESSLTLERGAFCAYEEDEAYEDDSSSNEDDELQCSARPFLITTRSVEHLYLSSESRICYALGLKIDFLDGLESYPDDTRSHLTLENWILNFLENSYEDIEEESLKKKLSDEFLVKLGFRDNSRAVMRILSRSELMFHHVDPLESVKRFVRDEFKYNPVLSEECDTTFYENERILMCSNDIRVISADTNSTVSPHISGLQGDSDDIVLFHGTDHSSAVDILLNGINVNLGLPKHDFSDGAGFYLTENLEDSEIWSRSQTCKPAVLVFTVPKTFLAEARRLDLTLEGKGPDWLQVVTQYRSGSQSKKTAKEHESVRLYRRTDFCTVFR